MERDQQLMRDVQCFANRNGTRKDAAEYLTEKLDGYSVAVGLANGPCPHRAAFWERAAMHRKGELKMFIKKK